MVLSGVRPLPHTPLGCMFGIFRLFGVFVICLIRERSFVVKKLTPVTALNSPSPLTSLCDRDLSDRLSALWKTTKEKENSETNEKQMKNK